MDFKERINAARAANGHPPLFVKEPEPHPGYLLFGKLLGQCILSAAIALVLWACLGVIAYALGKAWLPYLAMLGGIVFIRIVLFLFSKRA